MSCWDTARQPDGNTPLVCHTGGRAVHRQTGYVRAVLGLAIAGLIALVVAALTGSTPLAVVVVALAAAGIVQLVRDWRHDRTAAPGQQRPATPSEHTPGHTPRESAAALTPDDFSPDISTDPNGPSSDARADQS